MRGRSMSAPAALSNPVQPGQIECGHPSRWYAVANDAAEFVDRTCAQTTAVDEVGAAFCSMPVSMTDRTLLLKKLARILCDGSDDKGQEDKRPHVPVIVWLFGFRSMGAMGPTSSMRPQVESSSPRP